MSADNGLVVQRNSNGKFVVQHFFLSSESYPNPDEATKEYEDIGEAILAHADEARETEYGVFFNTQALSEDSDV